MITEYEAYVDGWNKRRGGHSHISNPHPEATQWRLCVAWNRGYWRAGASPLTACVHPERDGYSRVPVTA
jgi:hypothetical protein